MRRLAPALLLAVEATVFFSEDFSGDCAPLPLSPLPSPRRSHRCPRRAAGESRWVVSDWQRSANRSGRWEISTGRYFADAEAGKGLRTVDDNSYYAISARLAQPFSNRGRDLVIQYQVKHEEKGKHCGGAYIKLFPSTVRQATLRGPDPRCVPDPDDPTNTSHFHDDCEGEDAFNLMFGPDFCGAERRVVHALFHHRGEAKPLRRREEYLLPELDELSHLYTWVIRANGTYELLIDMNEEQSGVILDDWPFLPPKQIKDKRHRKPKDWVDEATILTGRHKPLWWDDVPKRIPDPEAVEPDDWDDAVDGQWAAPTIDNPEYKGAWKPKRVKNPAFKGKWVQPMKDNPDYFTDDDAGIYDDFGVVGIELWQVTAGTIFDNIFIGDDVDEARAHAEDTWHRWWPAERALKDRELRERYMKIYEDEDDDDDDDDDDEDDDEGEEDDAPPAPKQEL